MVSTLQPNRSLNPGRHRFNYLCLARRSSAKENWKTLQSAAKINWIIIITTSKYAHTCKSLPQMCIFYDLHGSDEVDEGSFFEKYYLNQIKTLPSADVPATNSSSSSPQIMMLIYIKYQVFALRCTRCCTENMLQIASKADSPRRNRRVAVNKLLICL